MGLKDRGDRLSQTWRWRWVPVPLGVLGPIPYVASVHHSAIQHVTISLEIKLSIKENLSNGKGDNSIITKNTVTLPGPYCQQNFPVFVPLWPESGQIINRQNVEKFLRFPAVIYVP
jgi:hypothetical protein